MRGKVESDEVSGNALIFHACWCRSPRTPLRCSPHTSVRHSCSDTDDAVRTDCVCLRLHPRHRAAPRRGVDRLGERRDLLVSPSLTDRLHRGLVGHVVDAVAEDERDGEVSTLQERIEVTSDRSDVNGLPSLSLSEPGAVTERTAVPSATNSSTSWPHAYI